MTLYLQKYGERGKACKVPELKCHGHKRKNSYLCSQVHVVSQMSLGSSLWLISISPGKYSENKMRFVEWLDLFEFVLCQMNEIERTGIEVGRGTFPPRWPLCKRGRLLFVNEKYVWKYTPDSFDNTQTYTLYSCKCWKYNTKVKDRKSHNILSLSAFFTHFAFDEIPSTWVSLTLHWQPFMCGEFASSLHFLISSARDLFDKKASAICQKNRKRTFIFCFPIFRTGSCPSSVPERAWAVRRPCQLLITSRHTGGSHTECWSKASDLNRLKKP